MVLLHSPRESRDLSANPLHGSRDGDRLIRWLSTVLIVSTVSIVSIVSMVSISERCLLVLIDSVASKLMTNYELDVCW